MRELQKLIGTYVGRKLAKEGNTNGRDWKKYAFVFDVDNKETNIWWVMTWTKKDGTTKAGMHPDKLKEGVEYNVSYTPNNFTNNEGQEVTAKNAICFFPIKNGEKKLETDNSIGGNNMVGLRMLTLEEVKKMAVDYKTQVDPKIMSPNHFLGTIIKTENKDLVKFVDEIYKEMIG